MHFALAVEKLLVPIFSGSSRYLLTLLTGLGCSRINPVALLCNLEVERLHQFPPKDPGDLEVAVASIPKSTANFQILGKAF